MQKAADVGSPMVMATAVLGLQTFGVCTGPGPVAEKGAHIMGAWQRTGLRTAQAGLMQHRTGYLKGRTQPHWEQSYLCRDIEK